MKRVLKALGLLVGLALLAAGAGALYVAWDWPVKAKVVAPDVHVEATPGRLVRGKALVNIRCAGCHYDQRTGAMSGVRMMDAPPAFGVLYSRNITRHPTKGIGRFTDGELVALLRTGVSRDGHFTGPFMLSPHLSDEDLASIVAFLRSDDPLTSPVDADDRPHEPTFLLRLLFHVAWKPLPLPSAPIPDPPAGDVVARGRYVAHALGDCFACHSASFQSLNLLQPEKSGGYFGGGNELTDASGAKLLASNLTPDAKTGLGAWTEDEFVRAVRVGVSRDGHVLRYPMPVFGDLTEAEVRAAYAYLRTVPPLEHAVPRSPAKPTSASATAGEAAYVKYACASCHGTTGAGVCDLRQASKKYPTDEQLTAFIRDASKLVPGTKMPTWAGVIPEPELADLVAHVHALEKASVAAPGRTND